jgi:hypothetical protein
MIDHTHENQQQLLFVAPHVDLAEVAGLALDFFCFLPLALPLPLLPLLPFLLGVLLPPLSPTCFRCFLLSPIFFSSC